MEAALAISRSFVEVEGESGGSFVLQRALKVSENVSYDLITLKLSVN
jgi:hypothetical protein